MSEIPFSIRSSRGGAVSLDNLTDVSITSASNGEILRHDGTNFVNVVPNYLDGAGIANDSLIKVVNGQAEDAYVTQTSVTNTSHQLQTLIPTNNILTVIIGTTIKSEFDGSLGRVHITANGATNGLTITSAGRVGIGVQNPEEDLELDGNIQLDTGGAQRGRVIFYDKQNDHEHAEVDGLGEGTNGGVLAFYTKVDGGSVTEKLRINNTGAIGIGGATYGTAGQVLTSNGSGSAVSWGTPTTYTAGTGVTISPSNVISIGQSVGTNDTPIFNALSLGSTIVNGGDLNFKNTSGIDVAQIIGTVPVGLNSGLIAMNVKRNNGSLVDRLIVSDNIVEISTDFGPLAFNTDDNTEQGMFYHDLFGTKDFTMDARAGVGNKGIAFSMNGSVKLKIGRDGDLGIGGSNFGNPGQVLVSNGSGSAVSWADQTTTTYSAGTGLNLNGTTFSNPYNSFYPGGKLYNASNVGIYGVARTDFSNVNHTFGIHGSDYGGINVLEMIYTGVGINIGCTDGNGWQGSQLLRLDRFNGQWFVQDIGAGTSVYIHPSSDDRIKTHEEVFSGETYLSYVKQIVPKKYRKYGVILTAEEEKLLEAGGDPFADRRTGDPIKDSVFIPKIEHGVIAQDIHKIPGLEDIVSVGDSTHQWKVDYRSLDTITLGAVKGLLARVEALELEVQTLKQRS